MGKRSIPTERLVKDFMRPLAQYFSIREDATVHEALKLIDKAKEEGRPQCLIVVRKVPSEIEIVKGFVTYSELLFGLSAHFLKGAQKSGPIFWEGQLEVECLEGVKKFIGEIMVPIKAYVLETELLMEAVFLLNKYQVDFLPVVNKDDVVGMIHLEDILEEISRIVLQQCPSRRSPSPGRHKR